jgi:hypothetical protein
VKKGGGENEATYDARWIVRRDDDILRPEFVQIESVPSEFGVGAVETLTAAHKLDEQRDRPLDDGLRLGQQSLVLCPRRGTLREERAGRGALTLGTGKEVCSHRWERTTIDRERGATFDVEARVRQWTEGRKGGRGGRQRCGSRRVAGLREDDGSDFREGDAR